MTHSSWNTVLSESGIEEKTRMIVETARLGDTTDPDLLDVTAKNATTETAFIAPPGPLVGWMIGHRRRLDAERKKAQSRTERADIDRREQEFFAHYTEKYLQHLRRTYRGDRKRWDALLSRRRIVLACFCTRPELCHRTILARVLEKLGALYLGDLGRHQLTLGGMNEWDG